MKKDDTTFLGHILESIEKIEEVTENISRKEFLDSWKIQDICFRRLEILGEATKNISETYKEGHEDIPWKKMAGTRDKLIHDYLGVDTEITWKIIKDELPKLKEQIKELLKK